MELIKAIYNHPLLTEEDYQHIYTKHRFQEFRKGDFFLKQGEVLNKYLILERGLMRAYLWNQDGEEISIDFYSSTKVVIDVLSLFKRVKTDINIQALTDACGWEITYDDFQELFHNIGGIREWGRQWMSLELFQARQRIIDFHTKSSTDRYLTLMAEQPEVVQNAPLKHIASYLGILDTSLSRIRKQVASMNRKQA